MAFVHLVGRQVVDVHRNQKGSSRQAGGLTRYRGHPCKRALARRLPAMFRTLDGNRPRRLARVGADERARPAQTISHGHH